MNSDMKRKAKQILCAKGFIDLVDVVEIKSLDDDLEKDENEVNDEGGCPFQLIMKNNKVISLKVRKVFRKFQNYFIFINTFLVIFEANTKRMDKSSE